MTKSKADRSGAATVLAMLAVLVLLFGGGYAAAYLNAGDKVPRGTTVGGVELGGRTHPDAVAALKAGLTERMDRPITVSISGAEQEVTPAEAGLGVDFVASVNAAGGGRSWDPQWLWDYYTGGEALEPHVTVDRLTMDALVRRLNAGAGRAPVDGRIVFRDGRAHEVAPRTGRRLDAQGARAAIESAYLADDPRAVLPLTDVEPAVGDAELREAMRRFANPALSGSVVLVFDRQQVRLQPQAFSHALGTRVVDGRLVPTVDQDVLARLLDSATGRRKQPRDATVRLVDGKPRVIPAKPGVTYDLDAAARALLRAAVRPEGERRAKVRATVTRPGFTTADARALGIRTRVSSFTTYFPYAEYRNTNIGRAAELVDGTLLKPGETFSLNDTVGERTRANGFTKGFVINDGIFAEDLGGGVSQLATTLFNAMFFAGLQDVEHQPHSFYIDRYPAGREATVAWPTVDLQFRNDTSHGVLISAKVTPSTPSRQGVVTVSMWSTKTWDIGSRSSDRYNLTPPGTRTLRGPDCYPNTGYDGFDIDVTRVFRRPGESTIDHTETFHTHYAPSDTVICK